MKWACIALLLANIGYFGWEFNQELNRASAVLQTQPKPVQGERLVLLQELEALPPLRNSHVAAAVPDDTAQPSAEEPIPAVAPDLGKDVEIVASQVIEGVNARFEEAGKCWIAGPVETREDAAEAAARLRQRGAIVRQRQQEQRERKRFWVYLEPLDSMEKAQEKLADLKEKGVEDYMLISGGNLKNAISLGVFSTQDSVNRRLKQLAERGFRPVVVPQYRPKTVFFVDFQLGDENVRELLPQGMRVEQTPCKKIAVLAESP